MDSFLRFLINQAHSISIACRESWRKLFNNDKVALKSYFFYEQKNVTNFGRFTFEVNAYIFNGKFFVFGIRKVLNLLDYFVKICPFWHNILANSKYQSFLERSKWTVINFVTNDLHITLFKIYENVIDRTMISKEKDNRYCFQFWHCHSSWIILHTFLAL